MTQVPQTRETIMLGWICIFILLNKIQLLTFFSGLTPWNIYVLDSDIVFVAVVASGVLLLNFSQDGFSYL
jgi:ABC-type xylose transport system permease subunit